MATAADVQTHEPFCWPIVERLKAHGCSMIELSLMLGAMA